VYKRQAHKRGLKIELILKLSMEDVFHDMLLSVSRTISRSELVR
jgi:hypothetical protein